MSVLTTIGGIPLFSSGQTGYMSGISHSTATSLSVGTKGPSLDLFDEYITPQAKPTVARTTGGDGGGSEASRGGSRSYGE